MSQNVKTKRTAVWKAPGPGSWVADRSHGEGGPTPLMRRMFEEETDDVYAEVFEELGAALGGVGVRVVNGDFYRRLIPLVGARFDRGTVPPNPVLWLVTRLHPAFRRREKTAARTIAERPQNAHIDNWHNHERERWVRENSNRQATDPTSLDDTALAAHIRDVGAHVVSGWRRHHHLHGYDLGAIGDLLVHAEDWGLDLVETMSLLKGSSPATTEITDHGATIADALRAGGADPSTIATIDEIRAVPAAAEALDEYLAEHGWRLVTSYDIDGKTLNELPGAITALVRRCADPAQRVVSATDHELEARLRAASEHPDQFDDLVEAARRAYGLRDDNGPLTWEWPAGLVRRAFLAAAPRLVAAGSLADPDHVFELDTHEVADLLDGRPTVSSDEAAERAARRAWEREQTGPDYLGAPPVIAPDLSAMPPSLKRLSRIVLIASNMLEPDPDVDRQTLEGLGIGDAPYKGTARVAHNAAEAISELEPGDILVAPYTAPSYNAVLAIAGAIVVQEGGLLCHAAVMARELSLPAIIGCRDAMASISSGDRIEVDPVAGLVRHL